MLILDLLNYYVINSISVNTCFTLVNSTNCNILLLLDYLVALKYFAFKIFILFYWLLCGFLLDMFVYIDTNLMGQ